MDLLTQLDSEIDLLLSIMSSSIAYISRKARHTVLPSSTIPLTILGKTESISAEEMDAAISELVTDLVDKAESIKQIIQHLPTEQDLGGEQELTAELQSMEKEMRVVNDEYRAVKEQVGRLKGEVEELVRLASERQREGRSWLVEELMGGERAKAGVA